MTGHCTKCKTRWTNNVKNITILGKKAKLFTCPKCSNTATQRIRVSKK